ncbi:MAG: hypothetical protein NTW19_07045 [Planctomycetota bacterium]|nr:hypothetical protein [Planctomycetota bacterium]
MTTRNTLALALSIASLTLLGSLGGCEREISRTSETRVNNSGAVKQKETVVRQAPDGTVTKEKTERSTNP